VLRCGRSLFKKDEIGLAGQGVGGKGGGKGKSCERKGGRKNIAGTDNGLRIEETKDQTVLAKKKGHGQESLDSLGPGVEKSLGGGARSKKTALRVRPYRNCLVPVGGQEVRKKTTEKSCE